MARCLGFGALWLLMLVVGMEAKNGYAPGSGIVAECLGNMIRLTLDSNFLQGRSLEVDAVYGTNVVPITNNLASQCGYSMKSDPWGNVRLFASLQNCFSYPLNDDDFNITVRLRLAGTTASEDSIQLVSNTCKHNLWAFREILCDRNYMEVSVRQSLLDIATKLPLEQRAPTKVSGSAVQEQAVTNEYSMWKVLFYMPGGEKTLTVEEAFKQGYALETTPKRLVFRGSKNSSEAYLTDVAGVPMHVLKTSTFFKQKWMVTLVDAAVVCPAGGVTFTEDLIIWTLPRIISPLLTSAAFTLLEVHMGIDGKLLDNVTMASRGYVLSVTDLYIIIQIPVGSEDGYYQSYAPEYQYHIAFTVEPMLELLWQEEDVHADTRYKVLYPITTPPTPRLPCVIDHTVPQKRMFEAVLGTFLPDVRLVNITFGSLLLSVAEANSKGLNIQENFFPNGSKTFSLQVPFSDPVVLKHTTELQVKVFRLPLVFGLLILPQLAPFSHPAVLEASLQDITLPTASGTCDRENFYVTVKYGSMGRNMLTMIGETSLTEIANGYGYKDNDTHFSIAVPFRAVDAVYELVEPFSLRTRVDLTFLDPVNNKKYNDFSIACYFPVTMAECFPNGTMTVLAIKVESAPHLNPMHLTLRDPSCKPVFYNDQVAYFSFSVNTCGTRRKFSKNLMIYENVVALPMMPSLSNSSIKAITSPLYRLQASCHYVINTTQMMAFNTRAQLNVPLAATGIGELSVRMRLSLDAAYTTFYQDTDYPVVKYLRQPLFFEVELMQSTDPLVELFLENCWATMDKNRTFPKWDVIVDSCENPGDHYPALFHPVSADARVTLPSHFKRFEMTMFAFTTNGTAVKEQVVVHCDVILCDASGPQESLCNKQCMDKQRISRLGTSMLKRVRRATEQKGPVKRLVSSGPVLLG